MILTMWSFIGIAVLSFSAVFGAYLAVFYTPSFKVASFAKASSMALYFVGIIMLFLTVGWWGFAGIVGYWLLFKLSRVHWDKRFEALLKAGIDPWHGKIQGKQLSNDD